MLTQTDIKLLRYKTGHGIYQDFIKREHIKIYEIKNFGITAYANKSYEHIEYPNIVIETIICHSEMEALSLLKQKRNSDITIIAIDNMNAGLIFGAELYANIKLLEKMYMINVYDECRWQELLIASCEDDMNCYIDYLIEHRMLLELWMKEAYDYYGHLNDSSLRYQGNNFDNGKDYKKYIDNTMVMGDIIMTLFRIMEIKRKEVVTSGLAALLICSGVLGNGNVNFESLFDSRRELETKLYEKYDAIMDLSTVVAYALCFGNNLINETQKTIEVDVGYDWIINIIERNIIEDGEWSQMEKLIIELQRFYKAKGELVVNTKILYGIIKYLRDNGHTYYKNGHIIVINTNKEVNMIIMSEIANFTVETVAVAIMDENTYETMSKEYCNKKELNFPKIRNEKNTKMREILKRIGHGQVSYLYPHSEIIISSCYINGKYLVGGCKYDQRRINLESSATGMILNIVRQIVTVPDRINYSNRKPHELVTDIEHLSNEH